MGIILQRGESERPYQLGWQAVGVDFKETAMSYDEFFSSIAHTGALDNGWLNIDSSNAPELEAFQFDLTVGTDGNVAYGYRGEESELDAYGDISDGEEIILALRILKATYQKTEIILTTQHNWIESLLIEFSYDGKDETIELKRTLVGDEYRYQNTDDQQLRRYFLENEGKSVPLAIRAKV